MVKMEEEEEEEEGKMEEEDEGKTEEEDEALGWIGCETTAEEGMLEGYEVAEVEGCEDEILQCRKSTADSNPRFRFFLSSVMSEG